MKAKLIKEIDYYNIQDEKGNIIGTSYQFKSPVGDNLHKLSKQNCDEIFGVVDVEKLADERFDKSTPELEYRNWAFKVGFNKAMELNKDKVFTEEDVRNAYMDGVSNGHNFGYPAIDHTDKYIQSLQQPTEIEVEIEMERIYNVLHKVNDNATGSFPYQPIAVGEKPKLDSEGCLILKKI